MNEIKSPFFDSPNFSSLSEKIKEFIENNKKLGSIIVNNYGKEDRGKFMAATVSCCQLLFDSVPEEWEPFWKIIKS